MSEDNARCIICSDIIKEHNPDYLCNDCLKTFDDNPVKWQSVILTIVVILGLILVTIY